MGDAQRDDAAEAGTPLDGLLTTLERIFADFERNQRAAMRESRDRRGNQV